MSSAKTFRILILMVFVLCAEATQAQAASLELSPLPEYLSSGTGCFFYGPIAGQTRMLVILQDGSGTRPQTAEDKGVALLNVNGEILRLPLRRGVSPGEHSVRDGVHQAILYSDGPFILRVRLTHGTPDPKCDQCKEMPAAGDFHLSRDKAILRFSSKEGGCGLL
jgi:hypothetical protein